MSTGTPEQSLLFGTTHPQTDAESGETGMDAQPFAVPPGETPSYAGIDGARVCFDTVDPVTEPDLSEMESIEHLEPPATQRSAAS